MLRARGSLETRPLNPLASNPQMFRPMPTDFSTIDLAAFNAAQGVIVAALRDRCCQWEQDSADAAAGGKLNAASMIQHWAFAADLLSTTISTEFANLFSKALNARFGVLTPTTHHSGAGCGCSGGRSSTGCDLTGCCLIAFEYPVQHLSDTANTLLCLDSHILGISHSKNFCLHRRGCLRANSYQTNNVYWQL